MKGIFVTMVWGMFAAACASYPRMTEPPIAPPASATFIEGTGAIQLYTSIEGDQNPRAVVWYVLGPEISSAPLYPNFTKALHQAGFVTAILHPRGTGYSPGLRGDIEDYTLFLEDYRAFLLHLTKRFPGKPLFLLGHSAGAAFALHIAATSQKALTGVILVNPAYQLSYAEGMGPSFCDYIVYAGNYIFRSSALTVDMNKNPEAVKNDEDRAEGIAMQKDPLVVRYFSMRYMSAQGEVMDACDENIAALDRPVLLIQGAFDALVNPAGNDELLSLARNSDKQKLIASSAGHGSSAVESMIPKLLEWLLKRVPEPAKPSDGAGD